MDQHPRSDPHPAADELANRRSRRVFVVGSVNQDVVVTVEHLPTPGETVEGIDIKSTPGGKGANQAVAAARGGAPVVFVGAVGDDDAARSSVAALSGEGIDVSQIVTVADRPTGSALVTVAADGENQIAIVAGANGALTAGAVEHALAKGGITGDDVCLVCFEVPDEAVAAAARASRRAGARLLVNPAPARPLVDEVVAAAAVLLPNSSEARTLTGLRGDDAGDAAAAARQLAKRTGAPVVVTLGADGVLILDEDGTRTVPALEVKAVDTTGAGDTFAGVFAAMLATGHGLDDAVRRGVTAAALSVTVAGTRDGIPDVKQIEAALRVD